MLDLKRNTSLLVDLCWRVPSGKWYKVEKPGHRAVIPSWS